ncbi:MAG: hypothetical protein QOC84_2131 [Bradyrhizobium sp.]|jgi:hypothetical protein|nr:hypothetical protein [Bradyrhizobium sp.]
MVLYHGCSDLSLYPASQTGIVVTGGPHHIAHSIGGARPDFGPGFYTTSWLHQAKNWANNRAAKLRPRHPAVKAVVLGMRIERNTFSELESLVFSSDRDNYFTFVAYCRSGGTPHAPPANRALPYDVIAGPVSIGRQTHVIAQADQVSFHTAKATTTITKVSVLALGNPDFDVTP